MQRRPLPLQAEFRGGERHTFGVTQNGECGQLALAHFGVEDQGGGPAAQRQQFVPALGDYEFAFDVFEQHAVRLLHDQPLTAALPEQFIPVETVQRQKRLVARQFPHGRRFGVDIKCEERQT